MLTRGIDEIANLLWLFQVDKGHLERWRLADRRTRLKEYGPAAVRKAIETLGQEPPIDELRYQKLCEVATHPVPGIAPGHFTGTGRPVLGGHFQEVGVYVCMSELGLAVAFSAISLSNIYCLEKAKQQEIFNSSSMLINNLGGFNINSYIDLLNDVWSKQ